MMGISAEWVPKEIGQDYREATVRTQSPLLIRQHNDDTLGCVSPAAPPLVLPLPPFVFSVWFSSTLSSLFDIFRQLNIPPTEYPLTFGRLDTFSSGRGIRNQTPSRRPPTSPSFFFSFFFCLSSVAQEKTATSANGSKAIESHKGNVGANPFWRIMKRKVTPANLWGAAASLTCNYFLFSCQIFLSLFFFLQRLPA